MCHPFHQIIMAESQVETSGERELSDARSSLAMQSRRGWLGSVVAAGAAAIAVFKGDSAALAQFGSAMTVPGTAATPGRATRPGTVTTQALGEEGGSGSYPPPDPGPVTTYALGEEGAGYPSPSYPSPSYPSPPSGPVTTQALGEEGACCPPVPSYPNRPGRPTTYALGEEGTRYYRRRSDYYRRYPSPPRTVTTFALGEEGAGVYRP